VAGSGYPRGYTPGPHQKPLACSKTSFFGAFSKPFYYGGEGGTLGPISPIRRFPRYEPAGCGYAIDYIVDYCSDEHCRIARMAVAVNALAADQLRNLIQS
jgi:hypothetical protein